MPNDPNEPLSDRELEAFSKLRGTLFSAMIVGLPASGQVTHAFDDGIEISTINSSDLGWEMVKLRG